MPDRLNARRGGCERTRPPPETSEPAAPPEIAAIPLVDIANDHPSVLGDPQPEALFMGFGDSALDFRLRCWIPRFEEGFLIKSQLCVAINAALRDAGIQIPFPQRDLHLRSVDSEAILSWSDSGQKK